MTLAGSLATFNPTLFQQRAAAVAGVSSSNVEIISARDASVLVNFRFVGLANAAAATTAATQFVALAQSTPAFTAAFTVLNVGLVQYTVAPTPRPSASSTMAVPVALLLAVVAFFAY
jgi:hypothetical protein